MGKKERQKPEVLLVQKGLVSENSVVELLASEVTPLSYWEILEGLGFEIRPIEDEIALTDEIRRKWAKGQKVTFDENTSARIGLVDLIIEMHRKGVIYRDNILGKGRDTVRYYLAAQEEMFLSQGSISLVPEESKNEVNAQEIQDYDSRLLKQGRFSSKITLQ